MSTIKAILAASDFSPGASRAARRAALLAREHATSLRLLHILPALSLSGFGLVSRASVYVEQHNLADATRRLAVVAKELRSVVDTVPECCTRIGRVLDELLAAAESADLVVVGAHGSRQLKDLLIGTTADRLLGKSRRPTLVAKQDPTCEYRRVIVPVDFSAPSISALRFAQQLAPTAELLVYHAYDVPCIGELRQGDAADGEIEQFRNDWRDEALSNMARLRNSHEEFGARTAFSVESGNAKMLIAAKATELGSDLIVMGKHGRSPIGEFFLGGVTRHTVARAPCDVVVVPEFPRS